MLLPNCRVSPAARRSHPALAKLRRAAAVYPGPFPHRPRELWDGRDKIVKFAGPGTQNCLVDPRADRQAGRLRGLPRFVAGSAVDTFHTPRFGFGYLAISSPCRAASLSNYSGGKGGLLRRIRDNPQGWSHTM